MRLELLWKPGLACERLAYKARQRRRLKKLRGTVAQGLGTGHIESLELLESLQPLGIRTVYDIGANVGTWALLAKALIPEATVEAFEPLPNVHEQFENELKQVTGVRLHRIALGDQNGSATLHMPEFVDASSVLPLGDEIRAELNVKAIHQVAVEMRRLDDYRAAAGIPLPDLIKLDVQGYELEVLKGATQCLGHARAVIAEVSFTEYYRRQCFFHDLVTFLADYELFLAILSDHTPTGAMLRQTDALFLRRCTDKQESQSAA